MKKSMLMLVLWHVGLLGFTQGLLMNALHYEVNTIYPPLSISKVTLEQAQTLADLNRHYKPSWVKRYISVEISAIVEGNTKMVTSQNDILSQTQKDLMAMADVGTEMSVRVRYIPENNLKQNDEKEMDFKFMVNPEIKAAYIGGEEALKTYLKVNAIDHIAEGVFEGYDLAVVKFTINETGEIVNPHIFESAKDEKTDDLLLQTIAKMPCWQPASYANGTKVSQEFALMVGNMESCVVYRLNTQHDND